MEDAEEGEIIKESQNDTVNYFFTPSESCELRESNTVKT